MKKQHLPFLITVVFFQQNPGAEAEDLFDDGAEQMEPLRDSVPKAEEISSLSVAWVAINGTVLLSLTFFPQTVCHTEGFLR